MIKQFIFLGAGTLHDESNGHQLIFLVCYFIQKHYKQHILSGHVLSQSLNMKSTNNNSVPKKIVQNKYKIPVHMHARQILLCFIRVIKSSKFSNLKKLFRTLLISLKILDSSQSHFHDHLIEKKPTTFRKFGKWLLSVCKLRVVSPVIQSSKAIQLRCLGPLSSI